MNIIQQFLDGLKQELTVIYGGPATGKTLLCLTAAAHVAKQGKKVLFIDTEKGFFIERFQHIIGNTESSYLDQIIVLRPTSFKGEHEIILKLEQFLQQPKIGLIVVDTLSYFYRRLQKSKLLLANRMLISQVNTLRSYASKIPVIVTNQVYTDVETQQQKMVGGEILLKSAQRLIELQKDPRKLLLKQPKAQEATFSIQEQGFVF